MPEIHPTLPNDGETADAGDISIPLTAILGLINGGLDADNLADAAVTSGKLADGAVTSAKVADNSLDLAAKASQWDGWIPITDTWAYASANTVTVPTNATNKYDVGDFISLVQSATTKYFRIQSLTATVLTLEGVSGVTVANSTISSPRYSKARTPHGMPSAGLDWWQEIARNTLTVAGDTLAVTGIPAMTYLKVIIRAMGTGGTVGFSLRFNNDSGSNYSQRLSSNGGADGTSTSQSSLPVAGAATYPFLGGIFEIFNMASLEKNIFGTRLGNFSGTGAGTAPDRGELMGKWANTSVQINEIDLLNLAGTGDFAIGSEIIVLGHN